MFFRYVSRLASVCAIAGLSVSPTLFAQNTARHGYYRFPAMHGDTIVFTAEGDLWSVSAQGGPARRLTSAPGMEAYPVISPDGLTVAFQASYEGPAEVYTMPIAGGLPERRTWDGDAWPAGWTPDGRIIVRTERYSTLPDSTLTLIDASNRPEPLPLAQASEASLSPDGSTLFFTRWPKQPSSNKRYRGGGAENIWSYALRATPAAEATPLTADYAGASHAPAVWNSRVYFLSDRDGVMNLYSMDFHGHDLRQETHRKGFDIASFSISEGKAVYSCAGELYLLDLTKNSATNREAADGTLIPVSLVSDFDQLREHWVKKPFEYITSAHISPDGSSAVITARGAVFTLPAKPGRVVKVAGESDTRFRDARFMPDGKSIVVLSTATGETEFWKYPANGVGPPEQWTRDAKVLRLDGIPSPDGRYLAHRDKDQQLWIYDTKAPAGATPNKLIAQSQWGDFADLSWSPDSRWLAFVETAANSFQQVKVLNLSTGQVQPLTSDRYNSVNPVWNADGKWLYFLSDRTLKTTVEAPWGPREPEPNFARAMKIYELALTPGLRSPFSPPDELHPDTPKKEDEEDKDGKKADSNPPEKAGDQKQEMKKVSTVEDSAHKKDDKEKADKKTEKSPEVKIDFTSIASRIDEIPVPAGNFDSLQAAEKRLCWLSGNDDTPRKAALQCFDIANKGDDPDTVLDDVRGYEISLDRKKLLASKGEDLFILDTDSKAADAKTLGKAKIDPSHWIYSTNTRDEYRGLFLDAWRLERDYYYDRHMQGVDWAANRDRYLPLVDRVADRDELNDVISQMVSELSTLHTFVFGGDEREPSDQIGLGSLGARLRRDEKLGGFVVEHVYLHDPDQPGAAPPLSLPNSIVKDGEVILSIDGQSLLTVPDERVLLRGKAGTQVLLKVKSTTGELRDVLVIPMPAREEYGLHYADWEYSRRLSVETASNNTIGYVHLKAMGGEDIDQWAREFYPVYDRQGLIIDVRHNNGGNIDSWLLSKLLRQAWFYWQPRVGSPIWNMQYAFRGHIVVLCDQNTASDGEAFSAGFQYFKMGKVIGTRTWGGEIWLSGDNVQADKGIATAAELGVYTPDGKWLIEGHGVDPDLIVDNLPAATATGSDAQLQAALDLLKQEIQADPRPVPPHPPYPDKSFPYPKP